MDLTKTQRASLLIAALSAASAAVAAQQASAWFQRRQLSGTTSLAAAVAILAVGPFLIRFFLDWFADATFIRKALLGDEFVAGTWIDVMWCDGAPCGYGLSKIRYRGSSMCYTGEDLKIDGTDGGHYWTDLLKLDWPNMRYTYLYQLRSNAEKIVGSVSSCSSKPAMRRPPNTKVRS